MSSRSRSDQEDSLALYRAFAYVTSFVQPTFVSVLAAVAPISAQCALTVAFVPVRSVLDSPVPSRLVAPLDMLMPRPCVSEQLPVAIKMNEQWCFLVHRPVSFRGVRE